MNVAGAKIGPADGPWELPPGWVWVPASSFAQIVGGGTPQSASDPRNFEPEGIPWLTPADLSGFSSATIHRGARSLSRYGFEHSAARMLPKGSVLISSRAPVGYCAVAGNDVCTNQGFKSLQLKAPLDPYFLRYYVLLAKHRLNDVASGTTFKEVSGAVLGTFLFPVAPMSEQRRIVERIDALFAEIAEGEAALAEARKRLDLFRRSLLKAAVTGELTRDWRRTNAPSESGAEFLAKLARARRSDASPRRFARHLADALLPDSSFLPEIPDDWCWTTLGSLVIAGPTNGYSPKKSTDGSGTLALKLTATTQGRIDLSEKAVKSLSETISAESDLFLRNGDLLFQRGNTIDYVGISAIYEGPENSYVYPDLMIRVRTPMRYLTDWLWRVANSPYGRKYMSGNATGTAGTMPKISGAILRDFPVPIPPPKETEEILRRVSEALAADDDAERQLDAEAADAARLKQSILKAAFEGRLVPQDPTDEPASALLQRLVAPSAGPRRRGRPARQPEPT